MATLRQTTSAGGLNEVRGQSILNHWWVNRAPSALAGSQSRGGAPNQRPQLKSEMQNHLVPQLCITHFTFASAYDEEEEHCTDQEPAAWKPTTGHLSTKQKVITLLHCTPSLSHFPSSLSFPPLSLSLLLTPSPPPSLSPPAFPSLSV